MTDIAQLGFNVNTGGLVRGERAMDKYAATGEKTERRTEKSSRSMASSYRMLASAVGSVTAAVLSMNKIVSVTREFNVLNAQLITATGSIDGAAMAFESLQSFAATTPYDLAQATKAFTQLVNLGLTPSEAAMESYGNTASAMGKDLSQMVEAVADATTGEFERLKEFGIKASSQGDRVSLTFQGVTTNIGKNANEIERYLMKIGQNEFTGAMEQRAKTLDGAISNLEDTWDSLFLTVSNRGIGNMMTVQAFKAANAIQSLDDYIASGAFENSFSAMAGRLDNYVIDFNQSFKIMGQIVDDSSTDWSGMMKWLGGNVVQMFKQLPEMARFYIQKITVEFAQWVDNVKIDSGVFVDYMSLAFSHVVSVAKVKGLQVANAFNPLADTEDYSSWLSILDNQFDEATNSLLARAAHERSVIQSHVDSSIMSFAMEAAAATSAYDKKIKKSDEMLAAYLKEKKARKEASNLGKFKINSVASGDSGLSGSAGGNEYQDWLNQVASETNIGKLKALEDEILNVWLAMDAGDLSSGVGKQKLAMLNEEMANIGKIDTPEVSSMFDDMADGSLKAMSAMSQMFESGTKDAQVLAIAMQSVQFAQSAMSGNVGGVIAGGIGMLASLDSMLSTELVDRSGGIQDRQGLNQWGEKATSMDDSLSIIANATSDLVGINTGMLKALANVKTSVSGASGAISKNVKGISAPTPDEMAFGFDGALEFLSGSSKTVDEGVRIIGGQLNDMLSDVTVQAYNTIDYKKWRYGSTHSKTAFKNVNDAVNQQFSLVFNSITDAVMSGASGLGISAKDAATAIGNVVIDDISVSTSGMSEAQRFEAFNNAFSKVFNDLSIAAIPWLNDLSDGVEGWGETLARVSTQVSIADLMADRFGVTFGSKLANPEMYAKAADNISTLVGGVEQWASLTSSFVDNFASDETKLSIHTDALTKSMSAVGLELPKTASGMWDLMNGLDASTEAGANQLTTLLKVGDTADEYYSMLNKQSEAMASLSDSFAGAVLDIYNLSDGVSQVGLDAAVTAARFGDFSLAEQLNLSDYKLDSSDFSSASAFNIAQAEAANKILEISQLSANAANDVQTKQLDTLNSINASIIAAQEATNDLLAEQNALQLESSESLDQLVNGQ